MLYFDPGRQAFVLDKVDSTFNMNLTRMPGSAGPEELSRRFPHLDVEDPVQESINVRGPGQKSSKPVSSSSSAPKPASSAQVKRKAEKKPPKNLALPVAAAPVQLPAAKPKAAKKTDEDEDEDDDDDGGLMIEYPEGPPARAVAAKHNDFSPAFPTQRRFDDYMNQRESEADDADGESDDEVDMDFKLPSPVNHSQNGHAAATAAHDVEDGVEAEGGQEDEEEDDGGMVDLEADLEKEMEIAFEDLANSNEEGGHNDESEISEED